MTAVEQSMQATMAGYRAHVHRQDASGYGEPIPHAECEGYPPASYARVTGITHEWEGDVDFAQMADVEFVFGAQA